MLPEETCQPDVSRSHRTALELVIRAPIRNAALWKMIDDAILEKIRMMITREYRLESGGTSPFRAATQKTAFPIDNRTIIEMPQARLSQRESSMPGAGGKEEP